MTRSTRVGIATASFFVIYFLNDRPQVSLEAIARLTTALAVAFFAYIVAGAVAEDRR